MNSDQGTGSRRSSLIWKTYVQASSALSVLGLINMTREIPFWVDIIKQIAAQWAAIARPIGSLLFGWMAKIAVIELTDFQKDYLVVGTLFGLGFIRFVFQSSRLSRSGLELSVGDRPSSSIAVVFFILAIIFLWPLLLITVLLIAGFNAAPRFFPISKDYIPDFVYFMLLPVGYFVLLLAASATYQGLGS
jgi:hypothetical protein